MRRTNICCNGKSFITYRRQGEDLLHPVPKEVAARRHHDAVDLPPAELGPPVPSGHDLQVGEGVLVSQGLVLLQYILSLRVVVKIQILNLNLFLN